MASLQDPGLLEMRTLAINRGDLTFRQTKEAERIAADQKMFLQTELKDRSFRHAARNVLALNLYHADKKQEAISHWKTTVKEDESNLNALKDLQKCYTDISDTDKADHYEELLEKAKQMEGEEKERMYARCQAEQAYALWCNLQTKYWETSDLRKKQVNAFKQALLLGNDSVSSEEKSSWHYHTGLAYSKLAQTQFRSNSNDEYKSVKLAIEHLKKSRDLNPNRSTVQTQFWCALGNLFTPNRDNSDHLKSIISEIDEEDDIKSKLKSLPKCYEEALKHEKNNQAWIYARLGQYYQKQSWKDKTKLDKAIETLDKSIQLVWGLPDTDPRKQSCRLAYISRANAYIKKAKNVKIQEKNKTKKIEYLKKAKQDSEMATKLNPIPGAYATAGEACHLLAELLADEKEELLHNALSHFKDALSTSDGASFSDTHLKRARCIKFKGDLKEATASYRRAFDTCPREAIDFMKIVAVEFLCCMFELHAGREKESDRRDETYWLKTVFNNLKESKLEIEYFVTRVSKRGHGTDILHAVQFMVEKDMNSFCLTVNGLLSSYTTNVSVTESKKANDLKDKFAKRREQQFPTVLTAAQSEGCQYDFYIINDEEDAPMDDWIQHSLLQELEEDHELKGYYQKRDAPLGRLTLEAHGEAIEKSAQALIVISHGFEENKLCRFLANMACTVFLDKAKIVLLFKARVQVPCFLTHCRQFDFSAQPYIHDLAGYLRP